ncbi:MAG: VWA domain-containing protein, partial [Solobacterium sp.]|nr:VWA domain-containing protein [Solobacterium sp.]
MSTLEAVFKLNPNYNPPDSEKEGQGFDTASKAKLEQWLEDLKKKQVPLDPNGCDKTAEVYDYENRIYRVDLTAKSNLTTFDGTVDLGFIIDASGLMQFPSKLSAEAGKQEIDINHINDNDTNKAWLDQSKYHYLIADKAGTATVYRLFYASYQEQTWYGTVTRTGWYAVDSSYADSDSRRFLIGSNSRFSNDAAGTHYQIYEDGDLKKDENGNQIYLDNGQPAGYKRLDYLQSSINGTVSELNSILGTLALAKNSTKNPDVQVAYNTFCATILHQQHSFSSVKNGFNIQWDTNGGTGTDLALHDAESFNWGQNNTTKNYAVLITDGAPQSGGRAIDNATVIAAANELKKGPDNTAGTADDVTLITVGLSMGDVKRGSVLLYDLADRDSDNEKMFFKAETGDELEYALYGIIQKILIDANVQGDVTDKVGEAFYPVDKNTGIPLKAGDEIDLDGNVVTGDTSYTGPRGVLGSDLQTFTWTDQEFTHEGWHGTVYVKAKEDFLGGNAVRTNEGNASIQAKTYKTPSMTQPVELREKKTDGTDTNYILEVNDLESPLVNVNEHQFSETDTEW